jgi:hypothetical protein
MTIIVFESITRLLKVEKLFKSKNIEYEIIPTPREISSDCGSAMRIENEFEVQLGVILKENMINCRTIKDGVEI